MKIYIDENLPPQLADALDKIQQVQNKKNNTSIEVFSIKREFGQGAKDEEWLPKISGCVLITQDERIHHKQHQRELYTSHKVGIIFYHAPSKSGWSFMEMTKRLVNDWEQIGKLALKKKPFAYKGTAKSKLSEL